MKLSLSVLTLGLASCGAAQASCVEALEAQISRDHYKASGFAAGATAATLGAASSGPAIPLVLGAAGASATTAAYFMASAEDYGNTRDLIKEAQMGAGRKLESAASKLDTTVEEVAAVVLDLDSKNAFCLDGLLSYRQVCKFVTAQFRR